MKEDRKLNIKKKKRQRQQETHLQKSVKRRKWFVIISIIVILCATLVFALYKKAEVTKSAEGRKKWEDAAEGKLLKNALQTRIDPRFRPVLIYLYRGKGKRPQFIGAGTWFEGRGGALVATAEHMLLKKFSKELFLFRFLCPDEHKITTGIQAVAYRNTDLKTPPDVDMVILRVGDPRTLPCFSEKAPEILEDFKGFKLDELDVGGGKKVKSLKSLTTGKEYPIVGATNEPPAVLIGYESVSGESGSGFVDEFGSLYILSGGTRGRADPITVLSGPFSNIETVW